MKLLTMNPLTCWGVYHSSQTCAIVGNYQEQRRPTVACPTGHESIQLLKRAGKTIARCLKCGVEWS